MSATSRTVQNRVIDTTVGRVIFSDHLPEGMPFINGLLKKKGLSDLVTFSYLRYYLWKRVVAWLRRKHAKPGWKHLRRQYFAHDWWPEWNGVRLFDPCTVKISGYRYRGTKIPTPWDPQPVTP